jgi:4-amino-4-deoxy-L-arabinose transferase-like glycosyltransferase
MTEQVDHRSQRAPDRWAPVLLLAGLVLFHAINDWIWLSKNLMTRGWDRIGALINSLYYHQTLSHLSLQTLFRAATQDEIRPPLFGLSMALMYGPFGLSQDVAVMVNVVYMGLLLAAAYGIGVKLRGRRLGMLAAALVALLPLLFAMSRYSYREFSLAALVLVSLYFLLASERFEKRGPSLLLGLSLGLGLLVKRTFPIFVVGAVLVVALQAGLPRKLWTGLRQRPHLRWWDLGLAIAAGGLLAAVWYFPNRELAQALPAGFWSFPIWWLLAGATVFVILQPASAVTNALSGGALALSFASIWYVPHSDFIQRALRAGWGVNDPRGRLVDLASVSTYTEYVSSILYGFSPFFALVLLLAAGLLLAYLVARRRRLLPGRWWDWNWWALIASLFVAYAILSSSIYKEERAILPVLPLLGIALAGVLLELPWRRLGAALIVLVLAFGLVQFFAVSYTEAQGLVKATSWSQPLLGQRGLFARGPYLEVPDSGLNDPGYYIAGDVLQCVEAARLSEGWDTISLGVVAGSDHVHVGMFVYDQLLHYPAIQVENPVLSHPEESGYDAASREDYLLVLDQGNRGPDVSETADLILNGRRSSFEQTYGVEKVYALPDGSEATLFRRRTRWSSAAATP